jgi:GAF domain-containing protein
VLTLGIVNILMGLGMLGSPVTLAQPPVWTRAVAAIVVAGIAIMAGFRQLHMDSTRAEKKASEALADLGKERSTLEERMNARTLQLRAVLEVSRTASAIHDPDKLTSDVVNLISDSFGYYYAAIFLLNQAGDTAVLQSATGEAGRLLKENRHSLPVGGRSMVGTAISGRQARVALDTDAEAVRFANPLLPFTRSEIAVPLIVGDRVLGALDVQSTSPGAFGPAEIDTLQGMANQVAIAFENARLFYEARSNLEELEAIQRQYIASAWQPLAERKDLQYSLGDEELSSKSTEIEVPLALRDQVIGAINLSSETDWTPDQRSLVEAIATQAALALENARLVESTQSTAQRERLLAEITGKVWSAPTRDGVLRTALSELGKALGAEHATIEFTTDNSNE